MGEVLKLLLLKEKKQMVLCAGGERRSHARHPSAPCLSCNAKRNGMRTRRGAKPPGSHHLPLPPTAPRGPPRCGPDPDSALFCSARTPEATEPSPRTGPALGLVRWHRPWLPSSLCPSPCPPSLRAGKSLHPRPDSTTHPDDAVQLAHGHLLGTLHSLQDLLLVLGGKSTGRSHCAPAHRDHAAQSHPSWKFSPYPRTPIIWAGLGFTPS